MKRLESVENRILSTKMIIDEIRNAMYEDKTISIKFYEDELAFYLFEGETGIYLNKYHYNYHPYVDFEGYDGSNARLGIEELKVVCNVMEVIENNLEEVLSWININNK